MLDPGSEENISISTHSLSTIQLSFWANTLGIHQHIDSPISWEYMLVRSCSSQPLSTFAVQYFSSHSTWWLDTHDGSGCQQEGSGRSLEGHMPSYSLLLWYPHSAVTLVILPIVLPQTGTDGYQWWGLHPQPAGRQSVKNIKISC